MAIVSFRSYDFDVKNFQPAIEVKPRVSYAYHLPAAERVIVPYLLRGADEFDASTVSAASVSVADEGTGRFLFQKQSLEKRPIASLTKLMTALVWLDMDGDMEQVVEIKSEDNREGSTPIFIPGEKVRAKDLFYTGLIASSNSAIASLARSSGLSEEQFVSHMNAKAEALGMKGTHFIEPTGLDAGNSSTAVDLFILAREAFSSPEIANATQMKSYQFSPEGCAARTVSSTNWLLGSSLNTGDYKIAGGKTGHIAESGYNLILKTYNKEKNKNLIVVILGSSENDSRFSEAKKLIEWTYKNYLWKI